MKILFVVSNSKALRTPQTKFELPLLKITVKLHFLSDLHNYVQRNTKTTKPI